MRLYGLIGYPLGHSFSASYFGDKFAKEEIDAEYRNFPLERISDFRNLLKQEPFLCGLNVTVPYKQKIIDYLDSLSATAETIRAVNTVSFRHKGGRRWLEGDNTDVIGFRHSLENHLKPHHTSALVLGTGGSSKAVMHVLGQLGIAYTMVSRSSTLRSDRSPNEQNSSTRRITYSELNGKLVHETTLIINTTPLGMYPRVKSSPDIPYHALTNDHLLFDLIYNPARTEFLAKGEKEGASVVNGYEMLRLQADASWKIWNS